MSKLLPKNLDAFWSSDQARKLKHPENIRSIMHVLEARPELLFDLTFFARFAQRTFTIMRREGKDASGFDRMQQSFTEAVEKVRKVLVEAGTLGYVNGAAYTSLDAHSFGRLVDLIDDLAVLKDWMLSEKTDA